MHNGIEVWYLKTVAQKPLQIIDKQSGHKKGCAGTHTHTHTHTPHQMYQTGHRLYHALVFWQAMWH